MSHALFSHVPRDAGRRQNADARGRSGTARQNWGGCTYADRPRVERADQIVDPRLVKPGNTYQAGEMVTVWRRLHLEVDRMANPLSTEGFDESDPYPVDGIAAPNTAGLEGALKVAFIKPVLITTAGVNQDTVPFSKNVGADGPSAVEYVRPYKQSVSVPGYVTVQLVGVYELLESCATADNDPDSELACRGLSRKDDAAKSGHVFIPMEVIQDMANQPGRPAWQPNQLAAFQEYVVIHEVGRVLGAATGAREFSVWPHDVMSVPPNEAEEGLAYRAIPRFLERSVDVIHRDGIWS